VTGCGLDESSSSSSLITGFLSPDASPPEPAVHSTSQASTWRASERFLNLRTSIMRTDYTSSRTDCHNE